MKRRKLTEKVEGLRSRSRRSNAEEEGDSQDDGEWKLLDGSWAAGSDSETEDSLKVLSRRKKKRTGSIFWFSILCFSSVGESLVQN